MHKLLITGVEETLGANLATALAERTDIVGLHSGQRAVQLPNVNTLVCDLADPQALHAAVLEIAPSAVIHCGRCAQASWDVVADDKMALQAEQEVAIVRSLADATIRLRSKLTVISTDAVFTGPRLFHEENETAGAASGFADAARAMEDALAATPTLIVRTCAYGWNPFGHASSFAERLWDELASARALALDAQSHATPILATDLAELLWVAAHRGLEGLYHITGAERTSQLRFAAELAALAGFDAPIVAAPPVESHAEQLTPARAETSLNTRRARRLLKSAMPLLSEGLERFVAQKRGMEPVVDHEAELLVASGRAA